MNPFKYGRVVSADDFCPRPQLLKQMMNFIMSGQNVVLQGERRVGKTSLIYEAVRRVKKCRMLYVDLLEIKSADELCKRLAKALISMEQQAGFIERILKSLSTLRPVVSTDPVTGELSLSLDATVRLKPDSIERLLDIVKKIDGKFRTVVVFDEFQDILNLPDCKESLAVLRSKIQFHRDIPYIFAGSIRNQMSDIFTNPESAFFKSAVSVDVGPLDEDEFVRFLTRRFASGKRVMAKSVMLKILKIAEDVPGDVQELCGAIWETTSYRSKILETNIPEALELIYSRESKGYESALIQLTEQQFKCLVGLAKMGGSAPQSAAFVRGAGLTLPAAVKKGIDKLVQLKIIYRHRGEYKFVNPFFRSWLIWKDY